MDGPVRREAENRALRLETGAESAGTSLIACEVPICVGGGGPQ